METGNTFAASLAAYLHRRFLWLLLGCYAAAAVVPGFGLWIRGVSFGEVAVAGETTRITLPMLMLALLLLNAGLGVRSSRLKELPRIWPVLLLGLAATLAVPVAFAFGTVPLLGAWLDTDETQSILLGLALIASMPVAGASTAWSHNAGGDLVLSLGLVVLSTLLSPVTTPVTLRLVGLIATGDYADDLRDLAAHGTGLFLAVCVIVPSRLGIILNWAVGEARVARAGPHLKLLNSFTLLLLIYANAATSLPEAVAYPDADFLLTALCLAAALCVLSFASGSVLSRLLGTGPQQKASLMFGLGMSNNGTGLVLASMALAGHPRVMLPIIAYNLIQHLVAGAVAYLLAGDKGPRARDDSFAGDGETGSGPNADSRGTSLPARTPAAK